METCLTTPEAYVAYATAIITAASALANFVPNIGIGKVLHWLALNIKVK